MTSTIDYLMTFRKCSNLDSLEKLYEKLQYSLTDDHEISNMYRAADHRRAELVSGKLFDLGKVPKSLWAQVF
ncbi:transcription modulator YdgT [Serratia microhaemolytica]|uniref:transcription modulator YdgT n=1 Tax=Serratia microhaemolytica TaxID=2675110 RepID=UPI000FDEAFFD|nr:transcription modulator YdgT [Serratia microhaemolytica]